MSIKSRILVPIILVLLLNLLVLGWYSYTRSVENATANSVQQAIGSIEQFKILRGYYTSQVVSKVLRETGLAVSYDHQDKQRTIPLPATMIHDLSALFAKTGDGTQLRLYSAFPFPNREQRRLDDFARQALGQLENNPEQVFSQTGSINGQPVARVAIADRMVADACVGCHNNHPETPKSDWRLGDVRGVLEMIVPINVPLMQASALSREVMLTLTASTLIMLLAIVFSVRRTTRRLQQTVDILDQAAAGDLTARMTRPSGDEVGHMGGALNDMLARNSSAIRAIAGHINALQQASEQLNALGQVLSASARETSSRAGDVAAASEETSRNIRAVASVIEDMTASTQKIAIDTGEAARITLAATDEIRDANTVIASLRASSNEIGEVISVITGIAEQTQLVALNASIEAARAGEAGKGFAVVAGEVQQLAGRITDATSDIETKIGAIQTDGANTAQIIERMSATLRRIDESQSAVAASIERQDTAYEGVGRNVQLAAQASSQIAEHIADVAGTAETALASVVQTQQAAEDLARMAGTLEQMVARFKYSEANDVAEGKPALERVTP